MMWGCIFEREAATLPRRERHFVARGLSAGILLALIVTAWLILNGVHEIVDVGDLAGFGSLVFPVLVPLTLFVLLFVTMISSLLAVSQEKDRKTLDLLLMSSLSNSEIVIGKISSGLLQGVNLLLPAVVVWFAATLFGGVSHRQVAAAAGLGIGAVAVGASWGATVAFWRDKTFQSLAVCVLGLFLAIAGLETLALQENTVGWFFQKIAPIQAVVDCVRPVDSPAGRSMSSSGLGAVLFLFVVAAVIGLVAIARLRVWNPSKGPVRRNMHDESLYDSEASDSFAQAKWKSRDSKTVWNNPVLWREACTWAYGRKILIVRLAYCLVGAAVVLGLRQLIADESIFARSDLNDELLPRAVQWLAPFMVVSLIIVNALAVNSITNERDSQSLDLLLASEISPTMFLVGKIVGVLYAAKEMVLFPLGIVVWLGLEGAVSVENWIFLSVGLLVMNLFAAMLGVHCGMIYSRSRGAIGTSLGTIFFLFVGVVACILIMISFRGSFERQLPAFLGLILGGGMALYVALASRQPSAALTLSAFGLPFLTFFAITSFLLRDHELTVFSVVSFTYGFTTLAMLVPALSEFQFSDSRESG